MAVQFCQARLEIIMRSQLARTFSSAVVHQHCNVTAIIAASLLSSERKRLYVTEHSPGPSVGLSVCRSVGAQSVLWQNGWLDPDAVWGGEWGGSRHWCTEWGPRVSRGRVVSGIFRHLRPIRLNGQNDVLFALKRIRLVCKKLTIFPTDKKLLETPFYWLSDGIVRFKIEVGVQQKCAKM